MKLKVLTTYTSSTANNHLTSPSGQYLKPDGTPYKAEDLTMLEDMYKEVLAGKMESFTDKKYVKKSMGNSGGPDAKGDKAPQHVDHFDHIVIQDIPASVDTQALTNIIKQELNSDIFYRENQGGGKFKNTYVTGEREILDRIEVSPSGNRHLHLFVNRRGIVSKQQLQDDLQKWKNSNDVNKDIVIDGIQNALGKMQIAGVDKALAQSLIMNNTYSQQLMLDRINTALQNAGISPIAQAGSYSPTDSNNRKTTPEAKQAVNEIIDNDFNEETVKKVVEEITTEEYSSVDGVIIQKRLAENKARAEQLATELQKLSSESRQLEQAQKAVNENSMLKGQLEKLSGVIERVNKTVEEKNEYIETLKVIHQDELDELNKDYRVKINQKDEEILEKTSKISELEEEFNVVWEDKKAVEEQLKDYQEKTEKELEQIPELKKALDNANKLNEQYQSMFETLQKNIEEEKQRTKAETEKVKLVESKLSEMIEKFNQEQAQKQKALEEVKQAQEEAKKAQEDIKIAKEEARQAQEDKKELAKANQELKAVNSTLSSTLTQFANLSTKLKNQYGAFIGTVKDKLKNNAKLKQAFATTFQDVDKQIKEVDKEVKTIVETQKVNKTLTDAQLKAMSMFATEEKKTTPTAIVDDKNKNTKPK